MGIRRGSSNTKSLLIILGALVVIAVAIILIVNNISAPPGAEATLEEGKDYDIQPAGQGKYQIIDETGNKIELQRLSPEVFQDKSGKRYKFVSGSPFKYIGTDK